MRASSNKSSIQQSLYSQKMDIDDPKCKDYLDKKVLKNKQNFDQKLKNMKPIVMKYAV